MHTFCLSRLLTSLMRIFAWSLAYNTNIQVNHRFTLTMEDTPPSLTKNYFYLFNARKIRYCLSSGFPSLVKVKD